MIITKTPLRIPIAGGGTDLPLFTKVTPGKVITMSVNQYIYTYIFNRHETETTIVQTSNLQEVNLNKDIKHNLIRETLNFFKIKKKIHVGFFSTMPTRSGIGSSSSLIVGLICAVLKLKKLKKNKKEISEIAIKIERVILNEKGGIQDQIAATYGGVNQIDCYKNYKFRVKKNIFGQKQINFLENNLILVYTKIKRYSPDIIKSQKKTNFRKYLQVKKDVDIILKIIKEKSSKKLGILLHDHWMRKREISKKMSNNSIDNLYNKLINSNFFWGGKLIGAGGGGFFLFVIKNKKKAREFLSDNKIDYTEIKLDKYGVKAIKF
jgi:D-glycero-alpha-D-manno-heptose-7-phosphate kinase